MEFEEKLLFLTKCLAVFVSIFYLLSPKTSKVDFAIYPSGKETIKFQQRSTAMT